MPTLTFKVTLAQAREVRRTARLHKLTVSDYLRRAVLAPAKPAKSARDDFTPGRVVIATPRLTKEMIDAALYD